MSAPGTFRAALRSRPLRLLLVSHGLGTVANQTLSLAVAVIVLRRTGSATWASATVAVSLIPYIVLSGYAGALADRFRRDQLLCWSAFLRCACAIPLIFISEAPALMLVALVAVVTALSTPSYPSLAASAPQSVGDDDLPAANALITGVENVAWLVAPGMFGLLTVLGLSPVLVVAVTAEMFALAGTAAAFAQLPHERAATSDDEDDVGNPWAVAVRLFQDVGTRRPLLISLIDNVSCGYVIVALTLLGAAPAEGDGLGGLTLTFSIGSLAAMALVNRFIAALAPGQALLFPLVTFGVTLLLLGWLGARGPIAVALVLIAGVATLLVEVLGVTLLQRATPESAHGRVLGVFDQLVIGAFSLGSFAAGPLSELLGAETALALVGAVTVVLTVLTLARRRPEVPAVELAEAEVSR